MFNIILCEEWVDYHQLLQWSTTYKYIRASFDRLYIRRQYSHVRVSLKVDAHRWQRAMACRSWLKFSISLNNWRESCPQSPWIPVRVNDEQPWSSWIEVRLVSQARTRDSPNLLDWSPLHLYMKNKLLIKICLSICSNLPALELSKNTTMGYCESCLTTSKQNLQLWCWFPVLNAFTYSCLLLWGVWLKSMLDQWYIYI